MQVQHMRSLSAQFDPVTKDFIRSGKGRVVLQSVTPEGEIEVGSHIFDKTVRFSRIPLSDPSNYFPRLRSNSATGR